MIELYTGRRGVDGQRKTHALISAALGGDRGVDADDFAVDVQQRAAAVAGIDRGVCLNEALELLRALDVAAGRAHDSRRHCRFEAERGADRDRPVAHLDGVRIADARGSKRRSCVDLDHGEIGFRGRSRSASRDIRPDRWGSSL